MADGQRVYVVVQADPNRRTDNDQAMRAYRDYTTRLDSGAFAAERRK